MRWCWLVVLAACGGPDGPETFPNATAIASIPDQIFEIVGDGTTIVWLTQAPSSLWRMRGDEAPRKIYSIPGEEQAGGLVLVNHQPYFEIFAGEGFPEILTVDDAGVSAQIGDNTWQLGGGDGSFLVRYAQTHITIADPRTGPERDPWQLELTSDNGTYVYGSGKIVHSLLAGGGGETIALGTGTRETFTYPHHTPLALVPANDGFFFYESGIGLFHATTAGTSQLSRDPGYATYVAAGDDLWFALTTPSRDLEVPMTALARIRSDGSADVRQLQADSAMVFTNGNQLMAVTRSMSDTVSPLTTIWRVDN
jgi:hypothetical protein